MYIYKILSLKKFMCFTIFVNITKVIKFFCTFF